MTSGPRGTQALQVSTACLALGNPTPYLLPVLIASLLLYTSSFLSPQSSLPVNIPFFSSEVSTEFEAFNDHALPSHDDHRDKEATSTSICIRESRGEEAPLRRPAWTVYDEPVGKTHARCQSSQLLWLEVTQASAE